MCIGAPCGIHGGHRACRPRTSSGTSPGSSSAGSGQIHTNLVMFGFVGSALIGAAHYLVPTSLRTPLYSERLGKLTLWLWNLAMLAGSSPLPGLHPEPGIRRVDLARGHRRAAVLALIFYNFLQTV